MITSIAAEGAGRFVGRHLSVRSRFLVLCSVLFRSVYYYDHFHSGRGSWSLCWPSPQC